MLLFIYYFTIIFIIAIMLHRAASLMQLINNKLFN